MKHTYDLNVFKRKDALTYYLLGVFCTDGNVSISSKGSGNCRIDSKDKDWLAVIAKHICKTTAVVLDTRSNCLRIEFYSRELAEWLISNNCVPNKSLNLEFPSIPVNHLTSFIRGCWDGDGTLGLYKVYRKNRNCYETSRTCRLYTSSLIFASSMVAALETLGIKSTIIPRKLGIRKIQNRIILSSKTNYMVSIQDKNSVMSFCEQVYSSENILGLARKQKVASKIIANIASLPKPISKKIIDLIRSGYPDNSLRKLSQKHNIPVTTIRRIISRVGKYAA